VLIILSVIIVAGVGSLLATRSTKTTKDASPSSMTFQQVVRTDLQATTELTGNVAYVSDRTVINRLGGREGGATLTRIAAQGSVIERGAKMFSINEAPVVMLVGPTPAWRKLEPGVAGTDVRQLESNLRALGYGGFTVDSRFTLETATAVRRWQRDIGAPVDGVVDLGEVVFLPNAGRVQQDLRTLGDPVEPGTEVMAVGPTTPVVTVDLTEAQLSLVAAGDRVIVRLANRTEIPGTVRTIGAAQQREGEQVIPAIITLSKPADAVKLVGSSAIIRVVTDTRKNVLAVPVTALLAVAGGGYAVEVDRGGRIVTVDVTPGIFDARGLVEITATGIQAGDRVVVAGP
jgi:peptidoglycan hydrolase-like protein with peptidoglycan-binding domain